MKPPPYVTFISADAIHLASLDCATARRLVDAGLKVRRSWLGDAQLSIDPPMANGRSSADEEDKLMRLAWLGVAFASDYKHGIDPVGVMLDLATRGRFVGTFQQIAWTGPGRWKLTTLPGPGSEH